MPLILNGFERACLLQDVRNEVFDRTEVCPEFLLWALSGAGLNQNRRSYEVLETYGDTMLKFAATLCAYEIYKNDPKAGEGEIENCRVLFITNFNTYRIGYHQLRLHRFVRLCKDAEGKEWTPPLCGAEARKGKCTGGSVADSVEALIGALFLTSNNLQEVLTFIDKIKLVPLSPLKLIQFESFKECAFSHLLDYPLQELTFTKDESLSSIFDKYFKLKCVVEDHDFGQSSRLQTLLSNAQQVGQFGQKINPISHLHS